MDINEMVKNGTARAFRGKTGLVHWATSESEVEFLRELYGDLEEVTNIIRAGEALVVDNKGRFELRLIERLQIEKMWCYE